MIVFNYGTMGSGKTATLCGFVNERKEQGLKVIVYAPATSKRTDKTIQSRNGDSVDAIAFSPVMDFYSLYKDKQPTTLVFDEVQFMSIHQIIQLQRLSELGFKIYCFGLLTDYNSDAFPASVELMCHADVINRQVARCEECGHAANYAILRNGGSFRTVYKVGGEDIYKSVCFKHNRNYN
ncbi:TPA: thymidine kinase [Photobacterium damselae]